MKTTRGCIGAALCLGMLACEPTPTTDSSFDEVTAVTRCQQSTRDAAPAAQRELADLVSAQRISPADCAELAKMLEMVQETDAMLDDLVQTNPDYLQLDGEATR